MVVQFDLRPLWYDSIIQSHDIGRLFPAPRKAHPAHSSHRPRVQHELSPGQRIEDSDELHNVQTPARSVRRDILLIAEPEVAVSLHIHPEAFFPCVSGALTDVLGVHGGRGLKGFVDLTLNPDTGFHIELVLVDLAGDAGVCFKLLEHLYSLPRDSAAPAVGNTGAACSPPRLCKVSA